MELILSGEKHQPSQSSSLALVITNAFWEFATNKNESQAPNMNPHSTEAPLLLSCIKRKWKALPKEPFSSRFLNHCNTFCAVFDTHWKKSNQLGGAGALTTGISQHDYFHPSAVALFLLTQTPRQRLINHKMSQVQILSILFVKGII